MDKNDEFDLTFGEEPARTTYTSVGNHGLTEDEEKDPNRIQVTISDPAPVVVLFGARTSGKTMTLVRLTRYLREKGYKVEPDRIFRNGNSDYYKEMCDEFDKNINSNDIAGEGTAVISFMLVKVMDARGKPICQILEAPGEHYFDAEDANKPFPLYINEICSRKNDKTWVFIVEKDWNNDSVRKSYANKIMKMESQIRSKDKIIFTCHKADLHPALISQGNPNVNEFFASIKNQYPGIFEKYKNRNPITSWYNKYNFDFVVFSAGIFNKTLDGGQMYTQGDDKYPAMLWKAILKTVKGNVF